MESFHKQIEIEGTLLDFSFERIFIDKSSKYFITVVGTCLKPYLFQMEQKNNQWKIIDAPKVPQWIHTAEPALEKAILEQKG